jgi:hypothetical protein
MMNLLSVKKVFTVQEYLNYERLNKGKKLICDMKNYLEEYGINLSNRCTRADVLAVGLGLILYSEKVLAAGDVIPIEPGFWKLISVIQKIVAGLALLYSYRVLAKMAAKGEGTWKEVGYGLLIAAADYGLPTAFKFIAGLF